MRAQHTNTSFECAYYCHSSIALAAHCCGLAPDLAQDSGWPHFPFPPAQQCAQSSSWWPCGAGCSCPSDSACGAAQQSDVNGGWTTKNTTLLHRRAKPLERAWQQVFKEAGARVMPQPLLRDMDLAVTSADDGRQLDFVACGLSPLPLCGDATIVSSLDSEGKPK